MRGKASEVVEATSRRRVNLCCLQETRLKTNLKFIAGRDSRYQYFGCGNDEGTCGEGILLAENWWEKVFEVIRVSDRIILIRVVVGSVRFVFVSVYASQANLSENVKEQFYYAFQSTIARVSASEQLIIIGDWNDHIGPQSNAFENVHGGQALGKRNHEGEGLLEFAVANELVVDNSWFKKKFVEEKKIVGEKCATQHKLVVGDFKVYTHFHPKRRFVPRTKTPKLREFGNHVKFSQCINPRKRNW